MSGLNANDGYPKPNILEYFEWLMLYPLFTEEGLRNRAERLKGTSSYKDLLNKVADARKEKGLSGVNAMKIVHQAQREAGAR